MAPSKHDDLKAGVRSVSSKGERTSETLPLLDPVHGASTFEPATTNSQVHTKSFHGEGVTIRAAVDPRDPRGLLTEADDMYEDVDRCCGYESTARAVLARLPALHTYTVMACFAFFGHWWLLVEVRKFHCRVSLSIAESLLRVGRGLM